MLLSLVLYINLLFMIISDFRKRLINVYLLAIFAFLVVYSVYNQYGSYILISRLILNSFFLVYMFTCLGLYIRLTKRKILDCIGLGDILFIVVLVPLFELRQFVIFLIITFMVSWIVSRLLSRYLKFTTIPLVTCMGLGLIIHDVLIRY